MAIRYAKAAGLSILSLLALIIIALGLGYWRLSSGPIEINFLKSRIESSINRQLTNARVQLGGAVLELDRQTGVPSIKFVNVALLGNDGSTVASAPRAAVDLDITQIVSGKISPRTLELIGPKVSATRKLDGSMELGIIAASSASEETDISFDDDPSSGKTDINGQDANAQVQGQPAPGARILDLLSGGGGISLEDIIISDAKLLFVDEANEARWYSPRADINLRRTPSGFQILADAEIVSKGEPWTAEIRADYLRDSKSFDATATITNLVPAHVADKVFALSQLAKLEIPMSGSIDFKISETGDLTEAKAVLAAQAGKIDLPRYFAFPITVDSGRILFAYDPQGGTIRIADSTIIVDGARTDLTGTITPVRGETGNLTALDIELASISGKTDPAQTPALVDNVTFKGRASTEEQRLDIDDLVVMSGATGVRLRGTVQGGDMSAGLQFAGRLRDVDAELLKRLWPPILASKTREWVSNNIIAGRISEGTFQVNYPPNVLASDIRNKALSNGAVELTMVLDGVSTRYFRGLAPLRDANGSAYLKDNVFGISIDKGKAVLASGETIAVESGYFEARELLADEVPGNVTINVSGSVASFVEYAKQQDLAVLNINVSQFPNLSGDAKASVGLSLPLVRNVPKERVTFETSLEIAGAALKDAIPGIDLSEGAFKIAINPDAVRVEGPAKLNGIASTIKWEKPRQGGSSTSQIETQIDEKTRVKLGFNVEDYIDGSIPVKVVAAGAGARDVKVEADLSKVAMRAAALQWSRPAREGTTGRLRLRTNDNGERLVEDIVISGPDLSITGDIRLAAKGGILSANLTEVSLGDGNVFAARITPGKGATDVKVTGKTLDARPYIKSIASPLSSSGNLKKPVVGDFVISAQFDRVFANRGEIILNTSASVSTRAGSISSASINGQFLNGLPINIKVTPAEGGRELRVTSSDGGATLRAANFYSKVAGGSLDFYALMANQPGSPIRNGELTLRNFDVRNEAALAELDKKGKPKRGGPRRDALGFKRLKVPFSTDEKFVRICKVEIIGPDIGAFASGVIRKSDGAMDISGTYTPAYALNRAFKDFPLLGDLLGSKQGIFAITFAMGGTMSKPRFQANPLSVLAPGILRQMFEYEQRGCGQNRRRQDVVTQGKTN